MHQSKTKERAITLHAHEARALAAGQLTQLWRPLPEMVGDFPHWPLDRLLGVQADGLHIRTQCAVDDDYEQVIRCPFGVVGTLLWGREKWCEAVDQNSLKLTGGYWYAADGEHVVKCDGDGFTTYCKNGWEASPWLSPTRMPRAASRFSFTLSGLAVHRLADLLADWKSLSAWGVEEVYETCTTCRGSGTHPYGDVCACDGGSNFVRSERAEAERIWQMTYGKRFPQASNPWCWVLNVEVTQ